MRYVELKGTPRECGRQHGEALRELIQEECYPIFFGSSLCEFEFGEEFTNQLLRCEKTIREYYPKAIEEIAGIAEGASIEYIQALQLNLRFVPGCCTYVGFVQENGEVVLGKNEDASCRKTLTMFKAQLASGVSYLHSTYAGMITLCCGNGINSMGLGVVGASLGPVEAVRSLDAVPIHMMFKMILERCATVEDCVKLIGSVPFSGSSNMAFTDKTRQLVGVEVVSGLRVDDMLHYPHDGAIYRSNHPLLPEPAELLDENPETEKALMNSRKRMETLDILVNQEPHNAEGLKTIFRSHHPHTFICQHYPTNGATMYSDGSYIMLPSEGKMLALLGYPCENEYEEYRL